MPEKNSEAAGTPAEPKKDVDDLIFRWESEQWPISER
jgi:hypothetical protein